MSERGWGGVGEGQKQGWGGGRGRGRKGEKKGEGRRSACSKPLGVNTFIYLYMHSNSFIIGKQSELT